MRIEAYNQVAQLYNANNRKANIKSTAATSARDEVSISQAGKDYQIAKKAVSEAADIREDKVAEMKSRIESGNYQVDAGDFAAKLLAKYSALS